MKFKERFIPLLSASLRIFLFLTIGSIILYLIINYLFSGLEFLYLILLVPIAIVVLFGMVAFTLSEIIRLETSNDNNSFHSYTRKELLSLYGRSFLVVACGVILAMLFVNMSVQTPNNETILLFLFFDASLTLYAISSIVKGEKMRELNIRRIQSENALLKSQLNPHFLYNTLNNIDALISYDTEKASDAVIRLSSLLRYMTYQGNKKQVFLKDEIGHLKEYVSLQQLRLENPSAILFESRIKNENIQIAPMLLMPFIENIFKHATDRIHDQAIKIYINADQSQFQLQTENVCKCSKEAFPNNGEGGMGLQVVKRRLKLLYPNCHELEVTQKEDSYKIMLKLYFK